MQKMEVGFYMVMWWWYIQFLQMLTLSFCFEIMFFICLWATGSIGSKNIITRALYSDVNITIYSIKDMKQQNRVHKQQTSLSKPLVTVELRANGLHAKTMTSIRTIYFWMQIYKNTYHYLLIHWLNPKLSNFFVRVWIE